jgi:hypothetical protein
VKRLEAQGSFAGAVRRRFRGLDRIRRKRVVRQEEAEEGGDVPPDRIEETGFDHRCS